MLDLSPYRWHERMVRVLVVDESPLFRRSLIVSMETHPDVEVVAEAATADRAVRRARELTPDVAFVAIRVAGGDARLALSLREVVPGIEVAVLTTPDDLPDAIRAIGAGARGFIPREAAHARAADVARALVAGQPVLQPAVATMVLDEYARLDAQGTSAPSQLEPPRLDPREQAVLIGLATGRSLPQVASSLDLPAATSANLCRNCLEKLHRHARSEGVVFAAASS